MLKELYATYGELMVSKEIIEGRIFEVKKRIQEELQKPIQPVATEKTN